MSRDCIGMVLAACIGLGGNLSSAQTSAPSVDPARYVAELRERRLMDATLQPQVQDVLQVLVNAAGRWPRGLVNAPYDAQALNVYLVDPQTVGPDGRAAPGTLRAFPSQRMILADARYLAALKAATVIYYDSLEREQRSVKMADAWVAALIEGPNHAVRSRLGQSVDWRQGSSWLFQGALAFLLAHEMGHLVAGLAPEPAVQERLPSYLKGRDRDRAWACSSLVGNYVNRKRREEADADAYALELLGAIPHPSRRGLRYEFGTLFLHAAELGRVAATLAVLSPTAQNLPLSGGLGVNPSTRQAISVALDRDAGMVYTAFPDSHPAQVERLFEVVSGFARNPRSVCCNDINAPADRAMYSMLVRRVCQPLEGGGTK